MNIFEKVKQETFIFTDNQIKEKIKLISNIGACDYTISKVERYEKPIDEIDITFYLYKDKGNLTKEEYTKEVIQYLYANSIDSKDKIDSVVEKNKSWFYEQYNEAINGNQLYYHAVQHIRHELMGFLNPKPYKYDENELDDLVDD